MTEVNELNEQDAPAGPDEPYTNEQTLKTMVVAIREHLRSGQQPSRVLAVKLREIVLFGTLAECVETGKSAWPSGFGNLKLVRMAPWRNKKIFGSEETVSVTRPRARIRYVMGTLLMPLLGYEGYHKSDRKRPNPFANVRPRAPQEPVTDSVTDSGV